MHAECDGGKFIVIELYYRNFARSRSVSQAPRSSFANDFGFEMKLPILTLVLLLLGLLNLPFCLLVHTKLHIRNERPNKKHKKERRLCSRYKKYIKGTPRCWGQTGHNIYPCSRRPVHFLFIRRRGGRGRTVAVSFVRREGQFQ